jgi:hypothetical protein
MIVPVVPMFREMAQVTNITSTLKFDASRSRARIVWREYKIVSEWKSDFLTTGLLV